MEKVQYEETQLNEEDVRLNKLKKLQEAGENPYKYSFDKSHATSWIIKNFDYLESGQSIEEKEFKCAGRIISKRNHGKAFFGNIQDETGSIQFYTNLNIIGKENFEKLLDLDTGDIIGINGFPFKTRRGELSLNTNNIELLSKSLLPLPEKYHGLQNKELRYRHRYIDLISNPETKLVFKTRSKTISLIRHFLENSDFMEVETPVLHNIYGGAAAKPFQTYHNDLEQNLYLRIALELHLKRIIVGGFEKIFEIGRVFRNEGVSYKHNPEYTLLELYQAYTDYNEMMDLTEKLLSYLVEKTHNNKVIKYKDQEIDFSKPFKRIKLTDILKEKLDVDCFSLESLQNKAKELKIDIPKDATKGHIIMELYDEFIEPNLIQPTFIIDHPWETSPLAKKHRNNNNLVERFELIINGMEIANSFSELNDPIDQYERFKDQLESKEKGNEEAHLMDEDFVKALKHGMPPTGGLGIGIDRVVMLLTNSHSIRDVLFFPHMREKN